MHPAWSQRANYRLIRGKTRLKWHSRGKKKNKKKQKQNKLIKSRKSSNTSRSLKILPLRGRCIILKNGGEEGEKRVRIQAKLLCGNRSPGPLRVRTAQRRYAQYSQPGPAPACRRDSWVGWKCWRGFTRSGDLGLNRGAEPGITGEERAQQLVVIPLYK